MDKKEALELAGLIPPKGAIEAGALVNPIPSNFSLAIFFVW